MNEKTRRIICLFIIGGILFILTEHIFKPGVSKGVKSAFRVR